MQITAKMVRDLRERTGAPMMDCKKALSAADGDVNGAEDHLRKQGLKSAAKKKDRETAEGRVFAAIDGESRRGHMVGVACETDFLAKSDGFIEFVSQLSNHVSNLDPDGVDDGQRPLQQQNWQGEGKRVGEVIQEQVGTFGENIRVTQMVRLENGSGRVGAYVHHDYKQGAIVSVTTEAAPDKAGEALKALCQHIVVFSPSYANRADVPGDALEREREVIADSDEVKSKPENIRDKIIEGKLSKFYAGCVLAQQPWIHDDKQSVQKALEQELGKGSRIESYVRVRLG
jgi:elongation factor Ts